MEGKPKTGTETIHMVYSRTLDAPVERVWRAWTDCEFLSRWWGPEAWTVPVCEIDLRPGGRFLLSLRPPEARDGDEVYAAGTYERIEPLRHLTFTDSFADSSGRLIQPTAAGKPPDFPAVSRLSVNLSGDGECTEMTVVHRGWTPGEQAEQTRLGMNESLDKLGAVLRESVAPGTVTITRLGQNVATMTAPPGLPFLETRTEYDARREHVFRAYTDPELLKRWLGPRDLDTTDVQMDARTGGSWEFAQHSPDGAVYRFRGVFHEVTPPERIVQTWEFLGAVPGEYLFLETVTYEELPGGRTALVTRTVYPSVELRDEDLLNSATFIKDSFGRLSELLSELLR